MAAWIWTGVATAATLAAVACEATRHKRGEHTAADRTAALRLNSAALLLLVLAMAAFAASGSPLWILPFTLLIFDILVAGALTDRVRGHDDSPEELTSGGWPMWKVKMYLRLLHLSFILIRRLNAAGQRGDAQVVVSEVEAIHCALGHGYNRSAILPNHEPLMQLEAWRRRPRD